MPRLARLDAPGVLHHIIIRGIERREIFRDNNDRDDFLKRLSIILPETNTSCYAWAFLGNHAHFLFRSGEAGISKVMRRLLTGYAVTFKSNMICLLNFLVSYNVSHTLTTIFLTNRTEFHFCVDPHRHSWVQLHMNGISGHRPS